MIILLSINYFKLSKVVYNEEMTDCSFFKSKSWFFNLA